jgi:hypothetical protein
VAAEVYVLLPRPPHFIQVGFMSRKSIFLLAVVVLVLAGAFIVRGWFATAQYEQVRALAPAYSSTLRDDAEWLTLFNGRDLEGWTAKITGYELGVNYNDTYRVEEGAITVNYSDYPEFDNTFGNLFYTVPYSHYVLRLEYRFTGEQVTDSPLMFWAWRNSGVMVHSQKPETMALEQWFPVSIEVQLLGAKAGEHRSTANLCTPASNVVLYGSAEVYTTHCTNSLSGSFDGDQWVTLEVEVWGSEQIRHFINGELVMEYTAPQLDPGDKDATELVAQRGGAGLLMSQGYIALQSESHPVQFRNIELHPIMQSGDSGAH